MGLKKSDLIHFEQSEEGSLKIVTNAEVARARYMKTKAYTGYPKPCDTCYWKKWPYARKDEICGFHNKPNEDGTCNFFEREFPEVENEYLLKMDRVRGLR